VEETAGASLDSVALSSRAADIGVAMEALRSAPEVREDRVAELAGQLQEGTLTMDGSSLAAKLLGQR
jgi:flagellar biosynthesis anti-sigma factor FlgM